MYEDLKRDLNEGFEFLGVEFGAGFKWVYLATLIGFTWCMVEVQYLPYTPRSLAEFGQLQSSAGDNDNSTYCKIRFPFLRK